LPFKNNNNNNNHRHVYEENDIFPLKSCYFLCN